MTEAGELLLAGGGHSHALLLKRWAMQPERRPPQSITLVNRCSTALYSGTVSYTHLTLPTILLV